MNPAVFCYLPPHTFGHTRSFLQNLADWRQKFDLVLYSEVAEFWTREFPHDCVQLRASPEIARPEGGKMWPAVSNMCFLTAMRLAQQKGYSHVIYLESDCRIARDEWDATIWEEYVKAGKPHAVGGSLVCFNPHTYSPRMRKAYDALVSLNWARNVPVACYGKPETAKPGDPQHPKVFPNGALAIYPVALMEELFQLKNGNTVEKARTMTAYDHELGELLRHKYDVDVFDYVVQLNTVYSTYQDQVITLEERKAMLLDPNRNIVGIHPVKDSWIGPKRSDFETRGKADGPPNQRQQISATESPVDAGVYTAAPTPVSIPLGAEQPNAQASVAEPPETMDKESSLPQVKPDTAPSTAAVKAPSKLRRGSRKQSGDASTPVSVTQPVDSSTPPVDASPIPRIDILIVTFAPDAWWLEQCLRSIGRFATGFGAVHVAYPDKDIMAFAPIGKRFESDVVSDIPVYWHPYKEADAPLAHLDHNIRKCRADEFCPDADLIAHIDSDCFFREAVTPADYLVDGKPVLLIESYEKLKTAHPGRYYWKQTVEQALKIDAKWETMCRHPAVHWRGLYPMMRGRVEQVHQMDFDAYVLGQKPDRPCGFAEFPTLGAFAERSKTFNPRYHFVDVDKMPRPHEKLLQFWSRQDPKLEQTIWIEGAMHKVIPADTISNLLSYP
jgi:hypothetical protein